MCIRELDAEGLNKIVDLRPDLVKEWNNKKNGNLRLETIYSKNIICVVRMELPKYEQPDTLHLSRHRDNMK